MNMNRPANPQRRRPREDQAGREDAEIDRPVLRASPPKHVTVHLLHHGIFLFSFLRRSHLLFGMYSYDWIHTLILLSSLNSSFIEL